MISCVIFLIFIGGSAFVREQQMRLSAIEMDLAAARQEGFVSGYLFQNDTQHSKKRHLAVIGIITTFGRKKNRDAIREAWMSTGNLSYRGKFSYFKFYWFSFNYALVF